MFRLSSLFSWLPMATISVCLVGWTSDAWAECGDWLAGHGENATMSSQDRGANHPAMPTPCDGPSCRRGLPDLPFAPPVELRLHHEQQAVLVAWTTNAADGMLIPLSRSEDRPSDPLDDALFRPPRG